MGGIRKSLRMVLSLPVTAQATYISRSPMKRGGYSEWDRNNEPPEDKGCLAVLLILFLLIGLAVLRGVWLWLNP